VLKEGLDGAYPNYTSSEKVAKRLETRALRAKVLQKESGGALSHRLAAPPGKREKSLTTILALHLNGGGGALLQDESGQS